MRTKVRTREAAWRRTRAETPERNFVDGGCGADADAEEADGAGIRVIRVSFKMMPNWWLGRWVGAPHVGCWPECRKSFSLL